MGQLVYTTKGMVDIDELEIEDHVEVGDNYRKVATEYKLNGEIVKRTVSVDGLRMPGSPATPGQMN